MENLKMVLHDGTEVALDEFSLPFHAVINCATETEALEKRALFTPENLSSVKIQTDAETLLEFANASIGGVQYVLNDTVTAHFYFDGERTATAAAYSAAGQILLGE